MNPDIALREKIRSLFLDSGAAACGFARASDLSKEALDGLRLWVESGCNAEMDYLSGHLPLKRNPENVLQGVSTVISLAYPFQVPERRFPVASYAVGSDYHKAMRKRLREPLNGLKEILGEEGRICIDSAPLAERYWAVESGIGVRCTSGMVAVRGAGVCVFLAEILLRTSLPPDSPSGNGIGCRRCGACVRVCPGGAISGDGTVDARRCLSYLTIEHKGPFPAEWQGKRLPRLFGCDLCIAVCPEKKTDVKILPEFAPRKEIVDLTPEAMKKMSQEEYDRKIISSPLRRAGLDSLRRNASQWTPGETPLNAREILP